MKITSILVIGLLSPITFQSTATLESFVFSNELLPEGVQPKPIVDPANLPCGVTSNPFISSDEDFLNCFIGNNMIQDPSLMEEVTGGLFSIYEAPSEVGIFGIESKSPESAERIFQAIKSSTPLTDSYQLLRKGKVVILFWYDRGKTNAIEQLELIIKGVE